MSQHQSKTWIEVGDLTVAYDDSSVSTFDSQGNASGWLTPDEARAFAADPPEWFAEADADGMAAPALKQAAKHLEGVE